MFCIFGRWSGGFLAVAVIVLVSVMSRRAPAADGGAGAAIRTTPAEDGQAGGGR
ncbi:hypothetical protein ACFSTC_11685 [Nonomuraea ferruginea]